MLERKTVTFVSSSELFDGYQNVWDAFSNCDPDCSYGDNSFSLVGKALVQGVLDELDCNEELSEEAVAAVQQRLDELPAGVYIDLES